MPELSIKTASPGSTSLSTLKPVAENNAVSEETTYSFLFLPFLTPIVKGLIPKGSLKATIPYPVIKATTAYAPFIRKCVFSTAAKKSFGLGKTASCLESSSAKIFNNTSESESVFMWRLSAWNSSAASFLEFVKFPLWAKLMP